jgi:hypothetical protein
MSASRETPSALAVSSKPEKADVLDELVATTTNFKIVPNAWRAPD